MRTSLPVLLGLGAFLALLGPVSNLSGQEKPATPTAWKDLLGEWSIVQSRKGGQEVEKRKADQTVVVLGADFLKVVEPSFTETAKVLKVEPAGSFSRIDFALPKSDGKVLEGIFSLEGEKLVFLWSKVPEKGKRPTSLESRGDSLVYLELTRKKAVFKGPLAPDQ